MTYNLRQPVLCDGHPGVICGKSSRDYNVVMLATGEIEANVKAERLRPRATVAEAVYAGR